MIEFTSKAECTGCGACRDMCPARAIHLCSDEEGFLYPQVDLEKCVKCGKCVKLCPVSGVIKHQNRAQKISAYAVLTKNEETRKSSSSGGMFTEIATYILQNGGVVFGAAFDEAFKVTHIGIDKIDYLNKLRGSKYVQSEIGSTYTQAKAHLDAGRMVLFTGTPCQIGGLYNFLGKDYENLYTQDIVCHGVPSPLVWQEYIAYREIKSAAKLQNAFFRNKEYGWKLFSVQLGFANGAAYTHVLTEDLYMRSFLRNLTLRPSCYSCAFKSKQRPSDFTLADFWGIEKICPEMDDDKGTSLVILHSSKAHSIFKKIVNNLSYKEVDVEEAFEYNPAMLTSVPQNVDRAKFFDSLRSSGFSGVIKYIRLPLLQRLRRTIKTLIKKSTRRS